MDYEQSRKSIGKTVIAADYWWGTYKGILKRIYEVHIPPYHSCEPSYRAVIKILECLEYPRQEAILFKDNKFVRKPFKAGEVHNFDLNDIKILNKDEVV